MSQDIEDTFAAWLRRGLSGLARRCRDVEGPACRNCRDCRKAQARGGGPLVRGGPVLGLRAAGPLPGRGRGGVRAAVAAAEDLTVGDQPGHRGADRAAAQGPGRAGPGRRAAHHRLAPGAPSPDPGLGGDRQPLPGPRRTGHPRPREAAEVVLPAVRRRAAQRVLAVRLHPLPARRRRGHRDPDLARRPLPLRSLAHRPRPGHRPGGPGRVPRRGRRSRSPGLDLDGQRAGLHHPVRRRQGRPQRPGSRAAPPGHHPEERQAEPPPDPGQSRTLPADDEEAGSAPRPPSPPPWPSCSPCSTRSPSSTTPAARTGHCRTAPPPPPPTPHVPRPHPATVPPTPTTASAPTAPTPSASSPCASTAASTTSAPATNTPGPPS